MKHLLMVEQKKKTCFFLVLLIYVSINVNTLLCITVFFCYTYNTQLLNGYMFIILKNVTEDIIVFDVMNHVDTVVIKVNAPMSMELE